MEMFGLNSLKEFFPGGDALLVLPPFAGIERPSLGLHVLQSVAQRAGLKVDIFNANVHFASIYGEDKYTKVCYAPTGDLSGEKVFAPIAFPEVEQNIDEETLRLGRQWTEAIAAFLASLDYPVIGCNTMFEQLTCSIAILCRLKKLAPDKITIIGGAQCESEMGEGILELGKGIDFVFSGESEDTFINFLQKPELHNQQVSGLIEGEPLQAMEKLPAVDYGSYFDQFSFICPDSEITKNKLHWLPLEGSRGCWWGQKHHCTFCGINGKGITYRMKSASKILEEVETQSAKYDCKNILMVDNIMPHDYFDSLLPMLAKKNLGLRIFYEQKSNLTATRMQKIGEAGINIIQPGIEALSDDLLVLMKKGVKSRQNIAALRHARMFDVYVNWNLLHSFPGDRAVHYRDTERLIPKLHHLCPPSGLCQLSIDRFSPYFDFPVKFGITNVRPMASYFDIFPPSADVKKLAYHFHGDYDSDALNDSKTLSKLRELVDSWISSWEDKDAPPVLSIARINDNTLLLTDTRQISTQRIRFVDRDSARAALFGTHREPGEKDIWCLENNLCVMINDVVVPLATTSYALYQDLAATEDHNQAQKHMKKQRIVNQPANMPLQSLRKPPSRKISAVPSSPAQSRS